MSLLWRNKQLRFGLAPDRIYVSGARAIELAANDGSWNAPVAALASSLGGMKGEASVVLADQFVRYVNGNVRAGADVIQLFDSWVGALSPADYEEFVAPYS